MAFCEKCGTELPNGAQFCTKCGAKNEYAVQGANIPVGKDDLKKIFIGIGAGVALLIFIIVVASVIGNRKTTIDMEKYIELNARGFEGFGIVNPVIDKDELYDFLLDNCKKLSRDEAKRFVGKMSLKASECEKLKNGQQITMTLKYDSDEAKNYKIKIKNKEWKYKIPNDAFDELKEIDAFADDVVKIEYTGTAPFVRCSVEYGNIDSQIGKLNYKSSKEIGKYGNYFNDGDTFTIECTTKEDRLLEYGYVLKEKEHTYTVTYDGLDSYITDPADLDETALSRMKNEAEDIINKNIADYTNVETGDAVYEGAAVLISKTGQLNERNSYVYLIYSVDCSSLADPDSDDWASGYFEPVKMYIPICFTSVIKYKDGTIDYNSVDRSIKNSDVPYYYFWGWKYLKGYRDPSTMFTEIIRQKTDIYNYTIDKSLEKLF